MSGAFKTIRLFPMVCIMVMLCAGCSSTLVKPSRQQTPTEHSGFLADYSLLQPEPSEPGYAYYIAPDFLSQHYRKFIIEPPVIIVNTGGRYQAMDPMQATEMTEYYKTRLAAALSRHYRIVTEPGPGVAIIRVAVVGMVEAKPEFKARDLVPVSAMFKVGRMVLGKDRLVLRMSMESEAVDAQTGVVLGESMDSRESTKTVTRGNPASADQVHDLIDFWVARFVARLDKANGFAP